MTYEIRDMKIEPKQQPNWQQKVLYIIMLGVKYLMKTYLPVLVVLNVITLLTGCRTIDIAYPVLVQENTFGFQSQWWDKNVVYVQIFIKDGSSTENGPDLPALIGPCSNATKGQMVDWSPFTIVWTVQTDNPVSAKDFRLFPGVIPEGFEQIIPDLSERFQPVPGQEYFIMVCMEPVDETFYSMGIKWIPSVRSLSFNDQTNTYTHEASKFAFPASIGRFQRDNNIRFYDETGNNFSVPYNFVTPEEKVVGTVYIYPSIRDYSITLIPKFGQTPEWFLKKHYDEAKTSIVNAYRARLLSESKYILNRYLFNAKGKKAVFEWDTVGGEMVLSHLYLFAHKGWLIKYRFTYPSKYNDVTKSEIEEFINWFQWP